MALTPATVIRLLEAPIDQTQEDQIRFASRSAQSTYFSGLTKHTFTSFNFQRKDNVIKVNKHIDELWNCNYVMYDNAQFTNRWFYAFITKMEYIGDSVTAIHIKTDVYQSWMLDCDFKASFVEREHIATDTAGNNLVPEPLELGDYVQNSTKTYAGLGTMDVIAATTESDDGIAATGRMLNNVFTAADFFGVAGSNGADLSTYVTGYIGVTRPALIAIYMCPHPFSNCGTTPSYVLPSQIDNKITVAGLTARTTVDGYTPKNKKLLTYPFSFLYVHNNNGQGQAYPFEYFDGTPEFDIIGSIMPNSQFKLYPANWELGDGVGSDEEFDLSLTLDGFPLCAWLYDAYNEWMATSGIKNAMGMGAGAIATAAGAFTGNLAVAAGGIAAVVSSLQTKHIASIQPATSTGNMNSGTANCADNRNDFIIYAKSVRKHQAEQLDDFFHMYGYQTNRVKVPNLSSRPYFNYVKTTGANIIGSVPSSDMAELKEIFNKGVTLWNSGANVGNYSLNNYN